MRIFSTTPAPTATAGAGPSPSKSSGDLFGQHLAGASQAASKAAAAQPTPYAVTSGAQAHPSSADAESSRASEAQTSAQTSSKDTQPGSPGSTSVGGSSAPGTESSPHPLLPPAVLALLRPATDFDVPTAAVLGPGSDPGGPKSTPSQAGKPAKDGEGHSSQKTEAGLSPSAGPQQPAAGTVPALLFLMTGGSVRGDGAQKAVAVPDSLKPAADADAKSSEQAPHHEAIEASPATGPVADAAGQQLPDAGALQLPQESFALPVTGSSTIASAPSAAAADGVSASQAGKDAQKGSADLQAGNSSGSTTNGSAASGPAANESKSGSPASTGAAAAGSAAAAAQSGVSPAQQGNASHPAVLQPGGLAANGAQSTTPVLHALAQDGGTARSSLAGAAPHAADVHGDAQEHLGEAAEPATATGIDSARVIQSMSQTEMQVGMHSVEFGDISIRASLTQQQMMAQISVNHDELSQAMMAHLSTIQTKIGNDYGLQASISVQHQGTATAGQGGGQSYQQQQQPHARSNQAINPAQSSVPEIRAHPVSVAAAGAAYRLDIQA